MASRDPRLDERTHYDLSTVKRSVHGDRFEDYPAGVPDKWHALDSATPHPMPMPELRSPEARGLDTRTFDRQVIAELVRSVDVVQALALRVDLLEGEREAQL